jgi:hypothetical protein
MSITLHAGQSQIISDLFVEKKIRNAVVCASRGFGKSYLAAAASVLAVQELCALPPDIPNKNVCLIAPTYQQTLDIYYPLIAYQFGMEDWAEKCSMHSGTFWFPNNVILKLWSYEASERLRGSGQYFAVLDEVTTWGGAGSSFRESWESVIRPCITTRWSPARAQEYGAASPGRALIISTPRGKDYFYDMYNNETVDDRWGSYHFTYKDSPYLDEEDIERDLHTMDPLQFKREYEASFEESGNSVFYNFNRKEHVTRDIPEFQEGEDVHVCIDFNVGIMAASAFALRGGQMHFLDDFIGHPDTETLGKKLKQLYGDKGHKVICYPDPTGRNRKSSAAVGRTDFSILQSFNFETRARTKNPPIIDSVASVNRLLKTAAGDINMVFHPRAKNTIRSMERTVWRENNPDSAVIDKSEGMEHHSDGVRYAAEYLHPVQAGLKKRSKQSYNF